MKSYFMIFTLLISLFSSALFLQAQNSDQVAGYEPVVVPANIKSLVNQITEAENNDNWQEYDILREQLIQAWQEVNPEVAKIYNNSTSGIPDQDAAGLPTSNEKLFNTPIEDYEVPMESPDWGSDMMIHSGKSYDISMDINADGHIYLAVNGRKDGTTAKDSVFVYKSTDGGTTWTEWGFIWLVAGTLQFEQIELMCFDRPGGAEAYILLFYRFDTGRLRVGRRDMNNPVGWNYYTIVDEGVIDFAVDRNYSVTNYRAMCIYDSSNSIYSTRSEPTSYGTVWQDKVNINGFVGRDVDFAYGWNGAVYTTFNGNNTGNLYAIENTDYADPTSWLASHTITFGNVDTTRHAEIIASREDDPNNKVIVVFERMNFGFYDLYDVERDNNVWGTYNTWVVPDENKWPSMSVEWSATEPQDFKAAFEQSLEGNLPPREIKYKGYDGSIWSQSFQMSDPTNDPTGLQKPEVGAVNGNAVIAYSGANSNGVYFDNESWTPVSVDDDILANPTEFQLYQNYPNPFNPSTNIKFSVPDVAFVNVKVFNSIGEQIAELVNENLEKGTYETSFNAVNLPSGVYFYTLRAGNFVESKKMVLMK